MNRWLRPLIAACMAGCGDAPPAADDSGGGAGESPPPVEQCNGEDDDGDGEVDEGYPAPYAERWWDADGDGFGDPDSSTWGCDALSGYVTNGDDCDDRDDRVAPGADERCNGIDDDCDGETDEEADLVDAGRFYPDRDGDGFGDPNAEPVEQCEGPGGTVSDATDCDDTDPAVSPAAVEICDGRDNDCDDTTTEEGLATFVTADGDRLDVSDRFTGTADAPVTRVLTEPGQLVLCAGVYHASLRLRADVAVEAYDPVAAPVTLSGADRRPGVVLRTDGVSARLSGLRIERGLGAGAVLGEWTAGGGVECAADAALDLEGVTIASSAADIGGGLYVEGCTVTAVDTTVTANDASAMGGGVAVTHGIVSFTDSRIERNDARNGAGLLAAGALGPVEIELVDTDVEQNAAVALGGGAMIEDAELACVATSAGDPGFRRNSGVIAGAAWLVRDATLVSEGCDWGGVGTSDDNTPGDFGGDFGEAGDDATFTCTAEGCSP